jgi:hypothetical protein
MGPLSCSCEQLIAIIVARSSEGSAKVPEVFGEGTTADRASAEMSDDELRRFSDGGMRT